MHHLKSILPCTCNLFKKESGEVRTPFREYLREGLGLGLYAPDLNFGHVLHRSTCLLGFQKFDFARPESVVLYRILFRANIFTDVANILATCKPLYLSSYTCMCMRTLCHISFNINLSGHKTTTTQKLLQMRYSWDMNTQY